MSSTKQWKRDTKCSVF